MNFAERLRAMREKAGFSQTEVAKRAGIPVTSYNSYETRGSQPGVDMLLKLAYALGCSVDDLVGYKKNEIETRLQGLQLLYGFSYNEIQDSNGQTFYAINYEGLPTLTLAAETLDQMISDCQKEADQAFSDLKNLEKVYCNNLLRIKIFEAAAAQNKK